MKIEWKIKHFVDLNKYELYDIFALRTKVFVVEQDCPYQELDGKDKHCFHVIGESEGIVIATARIIPSGISFPEASLGRVVVDIDFRRKGIAHSLMKETMAFIKGEFGKSPIKISAQEHLENFYTQHGFKSTEKKYLEDGIPHIEMLYQPLV